MSHHDLFWILIWWLFCLSLVKIYLLTYNLVCRPRFRCSDGDASTEVGYEELPTGKMIGESDERAYDESQMPHVQGSSMDHGLM